MQTLVEVVLLCCIHYPNQAVRIMDGCSYKFYSRVLCSALLSKLLCYKIGNHYFLEYKVMFSNCLFYQINGP